MADKDFKTIDEQIEILRSRGLTIEDEAEAIIIVSAAIP